VAANINERPFIVRRFSDLIIEIFLSVELFSQHFRIPQALIGQIRETGPITGKRVNMIQQQLRPSSRNIFFTNGAVQSKFWSAKGRLTPSKRKKTS
jgi:hypothetical protein